MNLLLGKGGFGTVRVVTHKETQMKYALKTIEMKCVETHEQYEFLLNEIEIMKKLDHPNIARYKFRSEEDTAKIVNKLINALRYCHDRNVAHRDIKLENICFESMADDAEVKLVDFGLSASFKDEQLRHDLVGSWAFMAPEVLQRAHHPQACDLWSMGVITYCLLAGFPPFRSVTLKGLKEKILYSKVTFEEEPWKSVSNNAKEFILKLLKKDPRKRLTAQQASTPCSSASLMRKTALEQLLLQIAVAGGGGDGGGGGGGGSGSAATDFLWAGKNMSDDRLSAAAQQHPWLTRARSNGGVNAKLSPKVVENLRHFKNLNLMKRVALGVVARTLEASEMRNLEQEFHKADIAKSGEISIEDFRAILLRSKQFQRKEVEEIFDGLDIGSSGLLSYTDFTAAALDRQTLDQRRLKYAFERLDHDNNGELDYEDLMMTVGSDLSTEDVRTAIKQFDTTGNGKVTFDDFCKGMRSAGGSLDALSTAQLTSGYMVESIAKGEGAAAIKSALTEIAGGEGACAKKMLTTGGGGDAKDRLKSGVSSDAKAKERAIQGEGRTHQSDAPKLAGTGAAIALEAAAGGVGTGAGAGAGARAGATPGSSRLLSAASLGRDSMSSSADTAAMSRPQSLERNSAAAMMKSTSVGSGEAVAVAAAMAAAAAAGAAGAAGGGGGGRGSSSVSALAGVPTAGVTPGGGGVGDEEAVPTREGEGSSVGGGTEATAPSPRKWSKEGGGEATPTASMGFWTADLRGSLAGRRMRDSIRLRGVLGGLFPGDPAATASGTGGAVMSPPIPQLAAGGELGSSSVRQLSASAPPADSSLSLTLAVPSSPPQPPLPGIEARAREVALARGVRQRQQQQQQQQGQVAGGALGAAAASRKSGGEPAERNRSPPWKIMAAAADLPPKDSTAGEADLGWGAEGLPPDLAASIAGSSSSAGSRNGNGSGGPRTPKSLRFGGVTARDGRNGGGGGGGRRSGRETFSGGRKGGEGDVYRTDDSVDSGAGRGPGNGRRRTGTFCMPGNASGLTRVLSPFSTYRHPGYTRGMKPTTCREGKL
eukprot:jgi/Undpi1/3377/HiC_scaffold_15.g06750.m1